MSIFLAGLWTAAAASAQTYTSTSAPLPIPDNQSPSLSSGVAMAINIADSFLITDLNVTVGCTHQFDGDLDIYLIAPDGRVLELSTDNGTSGDNYKNTTFDQQATAAITTGAAPFRNSFPPEGNVFPVSLGTVASLNDFNGLSAQGDWTLRVMDDGSGDVGTLDYFILSFNGVTHVGNAGSGTNDTAGMSTAQRGLNITMPDNTGPAAVVSFTVADNLVVGDVDLTFCTNHANLSQLRVTLRHPDGVTTADLFPALAGSGVNPTVSGFVDRPYATTCDDEAAAPITGGTAPYRGRFRCAGPGALGAFDGLPAAGTWTAEFRDGTSGIVGQVREALLNLRAAGAATGACVLPDGTCSVLTQVACAAQAGAYQGNNSSCPAVGRCCANGVCAIRTQANCGFIGGEWAGAESTCAASLTFTNSTAVPIPDNVPAGATSDIHVAAPNIVTSVEVDLDVDHTFVGNLIATLTCTPDAGVPVSVELFNRVGRVGDAGAGFGSDLVAGGQYTFTDDPSALDIWAAAAANPGTLPFGRYRPSTNDLSGTHPPNGAFTSLAGLAGQSAQGQWTLSVADNAIADVGMLHAWTLRINGGGESPCPQPANGACCAGPVCTANTSAGSCTGVWDAANTCAIAAGPPHSFCCPGNFNRDGVKNVGDIFAMLAEWFQHTPAANWDGSPSWEVGDIFLFLATWFQPC